MTQFKIHPIVMGTKIFDKTMMTYQHGYGQQYTIPIYAWYLKGADVNILVDSGEMSPIQSQSREDAIGGLSVAVDTADGTAVITGFCVIEENFNPPPEIRGMEMEVIPPGTHVNTYSAYDIMMKVKEMADILIPLHEPRFAAVDTVG